jgi:hypothetical protein
VRLEHLAVYHRDRFCSALVTKLDRLCEVTAEAPRELLQREIPKRRARKNGGKGPGGTTGRL